MLVAEQIAVDAFTGVGALGCVLAKHAQGDAVAAAGRTTDAVEPRSGAFAVSLEQAPGMALYKCQLSNVGVHAGTE